MSSLEKDDKDRNDENENENAKHSSTMNARMDPSSSSSSSSVSKSSKSSKKSPLNKDKEDSNLLEEENSIRNEVSTSAISGNFVGAFFVNTYSSFYIFIMYLISLESLLSIALSVSMTVWTYDRAKDNPDFDGSSMDWVLLSFAVITPMSASIGMAFSRRDQALVHIGSLKTTLWNIYSAHACWDWPKPGKEGRGACDYDWLHHGDQVLQTMMLLCQDLTRMLTLPNSSRARHRVTRFGKVEAEKIINLRVKLHKSIYRRVNILTTYCEAIKKQGLPPNEATRIRQWERMVTERVELLEMIKKYRTPQALRSFARLFSFLLPPFYAPFYGQMAIEMNSVGVGIAFSILTCIALTSLFESISQMEDPFVGLYVLDGIHVEKELGEHLLEELLECRTCHFPHAKNFKMDIFDPRLLPIPHKMRLLQAQEL